MLSLAKFYSFLLLNCVEKNAQFSPISAWNVDSGLENILNSCSMKTLENAQFSQISRETPTKLFKLCKMKTLQKMHSLAKFYVKCRFCLQNTVSAAKLCKDWKMHSLAKFLRKRRVWLENF